MGVFLFIIAGAVLFFVCLVVWAVARIARLGDVAVKVDGLTQELNRLGGRVTSLERQFAEASTLAHATVQQAATEFVPSCATAERADHQPVSVDPPVVHEPIVCAQPASVASTRTTTMPPLRPGPAASGKKPAPIPQRTVAPAPLAMASAAAPAKRSLSLEERLGRNWLNKLGIVTLVTGIALLLGYQLRTLGPLGKSLMGTLLSVAILVTGLVLERRERYRLFARAAIGGGWALLYFVSFAFCHVPAMQVLHSQAVDLVLMLVVANGMVVHSLRYRSQVVTSLAFLLGFLTVSISHVTVFSLVASAILAAGLIVVAFRERWFAMALGGLVAVYLNHFVWLQRVLPDGGQAGHPFPAFLPSAALLLFYWLLFRAFYIFRIPGNERDSLWSTANALLNSAGLLTVMKYQSSHPEWAFPGLLALGMAELALAFIARRRHHSAFVTLSCVASILLLAAVPFHFAGTTWSFLWLLQAELLFVTGLALRENVFRRLGVLSTFAAVGHLLVDGAMPVFNLRQIAPDASQHAMLAIAFGCAAAAIWLNAEWALRRWQYAAETDLDRSAFRGLSYAGALCATVAIWLAFAGPWTLLPWLALALLLGFVADSLGSIDLAQQADFLAITALARAAMINFGQWEHFTSAPRTLILGGSAALLYAQMRRKQPSYLLSQAAIEKVYAWSAAALVSTLTWYALQPAAISLAWCVQGLVLLEVGVETRRNFFRHQGFVLLAASFVRLFFINVALAPAPRLYTMLPLAVIFAYVYQRMFASEEHDRIDGFAAAGTSWFALGTVAALLYFSLHPEWVSIGGAVLAVGTLALARILRRPLFCAQSVALIVVTAARTLAFNMFSAETIAAPFIESRAFTVGVTCALLLAALPLALSLRKQQQHAAADVPAWLRVVRCPEQVLFFAPLLVLFVLIPMQLRAGMITVGWSALGLLTFLFALAVRERSFRLAGLCVLLVGVGKIVTIDVWHAPPMDRYLTLIVMGAALLLVSFLYSRYRETILELL